MYVCHTNQIGSTIYSQSNFLLGLGEAAFEHQSGDMSDILWLTT